MLKKLSFRVKLHLNHILKLILNNKVLKVLCHFWCLWSISGRCWWFMVFFH